MTKTLLLLISLMLSLCVKANYSPLITLTKVSPEGGVAITSVMCICEDQNGFIWFGTNNGLFKYNTHEIKRYSYSQSNESSISTNRINQILRNKKGELLIATENGICRYNSTFDNFTRLKIKDNFDQSIGTDIVSLFQTNDSLYWMLDEKGVAKSHLDFHKAEYVNIANKTNRARLLFKDNNDNLWVAFQDGSIYIKKQKENIFRFFAMGIPAYPRAFFVDNNKVWIGYDQDGLVCFDLQGNIIEHFNIDNKFPSDKIRSIVKAENDNLWVATYEGVVILDDLNIIEIITTEHYPKLPNHSIWSLYKDSKNTIWIGTWLGGLCYNSNLKNSFSHISQVNRQKDNNNYIVTCFAEDPDKHKIWIGTETGNLLVYSQESNTIKEIDVWYNNKKVKNIKSIAFDNKNRMWIGTREDGVLYREKDASSFKRLSTPFKTGLQTLCILPVEDGVWISDYQQGVFYYSFTYNRFKRHLHNPLKISSISDKHVRDIIQDNKGDIWLATQNGLNLYQKESESFKHFFYTQKDTNSLSEDYINTILADKKGNIWIGTNGGGLDRLDDSTNIFEHFTTRNKLPGNDIYTILEDKDGNLWLATDNGICKFNPESKKVLTFGHVEGIYNNSLNPNAGLYSKNGLIFFGGSNGFVYFKPDDIIIRNTIKPQTLITNFYINNKEILPGQENRLIENHISNTKSIKLSYNQNSFSFKYVANNYINPDKNRFKYRLKNFNKNWTETGINQAANFTNVPPGKYTFEIIASNNDGVWNDNLTKIEIKIQAPLWASWYAYLIYMLISVAIIVYMRNQTINRQKLKTQFELEKVKRESDEKLNQIKLQFFTNITHEFRTPLTLIMGPINRIINNYKHDDLILNQLNMVKNNSERLLRLINQILDFRKIEAGKLSLNTTNKDIIDFSKHIFNCFKEHAKHRSFEYNFIPKTSNINIDFDPEKLDKIIFNILSNSFKYCPDGGKIEMILKEGAETDYSPSNSNEYFIGNKNLNEYYEISISDTGKGILEENIPKIFERFHQLDNKNQQGSGIGLALTKDYINLHNGALKIKSNLKEGTTICIRLPYTQTNNQTLEQLQTNTTIIEELKTKSNTKPVNSNDEISETQHHDSLILIVEDNTELLNYLGSLLKDNFKVAKAKNGVEGIEQVNALFPDIIISDIMMPEMDGIELCEHIKTDVKTSHIPIILLTALETIRDRISGLSSGADAYISKPFNDKLLIAQVLNLLESRKLLRESFANIEEVWDNGVETMDIDKKLILKAIQVVESNIKNFNFTVDMLAKELNLSRTTLHRKLKSLTNQSATEFIRYLRLKNAVKLLQTGNHKVNEVGFAVGFNSHNYFTTSFKKQYGMSPSEYLKKNSFNA